MPKTIPFKCSEFFKNHVSLRIILSLSACYLYTRKLKRNSRISLLREIMTKIETVQWNVSRANGVPYGTVPMQEKNRVRKSRATVPCAKVGRYRNGISFFAVKLKIL